ncbi:MAG: M1 family aminopeptidase [Candidatus Aminicenantaceae bacterium]
MKKTAIILLVTFLLLAFFLLNCHKTPGGPEAEEKPYFFVPREPPPADYILDAKVKEKDQAALLEGTGRIVLRNSSEKKLSIIALEWAGSSLAVWVDGQKLEPAEEKSFEEEVRFFSLPNEVRPEGEISLDLEFSFNAGADDNGDILMRDWYPKLWWESLPTQDSFQVKVDVPSGYTLASSGRMNPETGYYENPGVTTRFGLVLFRDINLEERDAGGVQVRAFFTDEGKECALLCLETAVDAIGFYENFHGFFPFPSLTIIPGMASYVGGYPFASALVVIHGQQAFRKQPELHWKWITAHEIGHQYWGEHVMSSRHKNYPDSWLMIGMGIIADRMYVEHKKLGNEKHEYFFNRYLRGVKNRFDTTADAPETLRRQQKYDRNNILIHGKGYAILSALRSTVGDDTFKKIYLRSLEEYGGKGMSYHDLRYIAEEESGENLHWFFDQWVRSSNYLCYRITQAECRPEGDGFVTEAVVEKLGKSMAMPVEVMAVFEDGSAEMDRVSRFSQKETLVFRSESELKEVKLDPFNRWAMLAEPLEGLPEKTKDLPYQGAWNKGLELYGDALEADCRDHEIWFKLGMVIFEGGYFEEAFSCFQKILDLDAPELFDFTAVTWQGNIRDAQGRREEAVEFYREALGMAEGKITMRHDQFGIQTSREWIEQRLASPFNWKTIVKR